MIQKIVFVGLHYLFFSAFVVASWGGGSLALKRALNSHKSRSWLEHALAITAGMALFICFLQWLAIAGQLRVIWIAAFAGAGILAAMLQLREYGFAPIQDFCLSWKSLTPNEKRGLLVVLLFVAATLLRPLGPPMEWDEVMYHLPHAKQWALTGHLGIHEWLRYPWFPYNYDLLYSGALLVSDDVLPHLIHACAGWLVAIILYQLGKQHANHTVACVATIIWLFLSRRDFDNAYIDMGVTLFVFASCAAFHLWLENRSKPVWLAAAAFFMGIAIGSKYQALSFLPVFAVVLLIYERRPRFLLLTVVCLLVPCIYWYARNVILTGDPFNPVGGRIFGFTDWNLADYKAQFQDLKNHTGWPNFTLWPVLLVPFIGTWRQSISVRRAMIFCAYSIPVWMVTSHYPRYLMPVFPLLALLAAIGWQWIGTQIFHGLGKLNAASKEALLRPRTLNVGWHVLLVLLCVAVAFDLTRGWRRIAPSSEARNALLEDRISGYKVFAYMREHPAAGKIYQFGLEDAIYYAPSPIWGDHFGPFRYGDFSNLQPAQLAEKFRNLGFTDVLIHTERWPQIDSRPEFDQYFLQVYEADDVKLYRVK